MARESNSSIMSVGEMIDNAFGEPDVNVVNHKLIHTILIILARQLRILERRVAIELGPQIQPSSSSLSITEVKVHAMTKKKKKIIKGTFSKTGAGLGREGVVAGGRSSGRFGTGGVGAGGGGPRGEGAGGTGGMGAGGGGPRGGDVGGTGGGGLRVGGAGGTGEVGAGGGGPRGGGAGGTGQGLGELTSVSEKTPSDRTSSDKTSSDKTTSQKTSSDKTSSDKTSSDKTTTAISSSGKTSTEKTSSGKTSTEKTSSDKSSKEKSTSDKIPSDETATDKTSSVKTSSDKTSSDKTSSDKTSSDKTSSDKTSSDKTSSVKTSTEKTSSDKTSTEKTTSGKTTSDKTSTEKTSSDKTSSAITSSEPTSSSKDKSSSSKDKTSSDKYTTSTSDKTSTEKSSSGKTTTSTDKSSSARRSPGDVKFLESVEEQREIELRVIHQRVDSREEYERTPTPMASLDSVEATYEKLLIVERLPSEEARAIAARDRSGVRDKTPRLSVVTQEQFEKLATTVRQLQLKFGPIGSASLPENAQLMKELRKGASLTDAMAALQLSARLEATEKTLGQMLSLVTDLASKTPGVDMSEETAPEEMQVLFGAKGAKDKKSKTDAVASRKSSTFQKSTKGKKEPSLPPSTPSQQSVQISLPHSFMDFEADQTKDTTGAVTEEGEKEKPDRITYEELDDAMQGLHDEIIKTVKNLTAKSTANAEYAYKMASKLEGRLDASMNLGRRMMGLETLVSDYAEQINILDTSLSSQMSNYQEELTQMQHDLETALETMAEVLANAGGDTTAVAELNAQFSNLQSDIDNTMMKQKDLKNIQNALAFDLESLRKQIEILREAKSDRDEVADALRDKAGLGALNGLVPVQQFNATRGDIEKRIGAAYDKFNSQEIIWQRAIDDLLRELNEKADWIQVVSLKDDIMRNLEILRSRLNEMMDIVGEPKAAATSKKLQRDVNCLSCAAPASMELEEPGKVPALPGLRPPAIGAEASKPKEDGDHVPCYPGRPIPHPRDPRSHVCQRWCGGSHTLVMNTVSRAPTSMIITPAIREVTTALGTDGKVYMVDEKTMKPCAQCTIHKLTPQPSITEHVEEQEDVSSDMTPEDFRRSIRPSQVTELPATTLSEDMMTPPPPLDED